LDGDHSLNATHVLVFHLLDDGVVVAMAMVAVMMAMVVVVVVVMVMMVEILCNKVEMQYEDASIVTRLKNRAAMVIM
jgi:ABC-type sulfate transport system permease component